MMQHSQIHDFSNNAASPWAQARQVATCKSGLNLPGLRKVTEVKVRCIEAEKHDGDTVEISLSEDDFLESAMVDRDGLLHLMTCSSKGSHDGFAFQGRSVCVLDPDEEGVHMQVPDLTCRSQTTDGGQYLLTNLLDVQGISPYMVERQAYEFLDPKKHHVAHVGEVVLHNLDPTEMYTPRTLFRNVVRVAVPEINQSLLELTVLDAGARSLLSKDNPSPLDAVYVPTDSAETSAHAIASSMEHFCGEGDESCIAVEDFALADPSRVPRYVITVDAEKNIHDARRLAPRY